MKNNKQGGKKLLEFAKFTLVAGKEDWLGTMVLGSERGMLEIVQNVLTGSDTNYSAS